MAHPDENAAAPDLTAGVPASSIPDTSSLVGKVGKSDVLLVRTGGRLFAVGAYCTHYRGKLSEGLVVGETVRCPLHHACFSLTTGEALRAPALDPIACWRVEERDGTVFVRERIQAPLPAPAPSGQRPASVLIVGGGAAGLAAADMLRREGYDNPITIVSADPDAPVDRPNLSKDYLAGEAQDDWIPLWPAALYAERRIDLRLNSRAVSIDTAGRTVTLENGTSLGFGALLLAAGADPVTLPIAGSDAGRILYLRTFKDSQAIVERAKNARQVVVLGASFIGLEVAASLRARGIEVDVVAPEQLPLERVMGFEIGRFVQNLHEAHGVSFHLGQTVAAIDGDTVRLSGGATLRADFVVAGVGVRPSIALAESAGITVDRGIVVNEYLETSAPGIFAAGDLARWPDPHTGERIRVEHWVVAERQGQVAARNMLGGQEPFDAVPFFWSQHYDLTIRYVGHAERWDEVRVDGSLAAHDASVTFLDKGRRLAVATISRDKENLQAEVELESDRVRA
jgi:NADPH-dependent 2,4-dienoyl-CoA reductase/sulfur reductase-like enzyme/nitrite reductase/ring-hydroxylating ferredoxin subunit